MSELSVAARVRAGWRNWLRKQRRTPYIGDLRLISLEHRARYRPFFESGNLGQALGALLAAARNDHLRTTPTLARQAPER